MKGGKNEKRIADRIFAWYRKDVRQILLLGKRENFWRKLYKDIANKEAAAQP